MAMMGIVAWTLFATIHTRPHNKSWICFCCEHGVVVWVMLSAIWGNASMGSKMKTLGWPTRGQRQQCVLQIQQGTFSIWTSSITAWDADLTTETSIPNGWTNLDLIWRDTRLICTVGSVASIPAAPKLGPAGFYVLLQRPGMFTVLPTNFLHILFKSKKTKQLLEFFSKMNVSIPTRLQAVGLMGSRELLFYSGDKLQWITKSTGNTHHIPALPKSQAHWSDCRPHQHSALGNSELRRGIFFGRWHHGS